MRPGFDHEILAELLYGSLSLSRHTRFAVGFSGGLDSTALLLGLSRLMTQQSQGELLALHFNHGLHPQSDRWQHHCEQCCRQLNVPIVCGKWHHGSSAKLDEGSARTARYDWFRCALPRSHLLLLAHHMDDQIETCLMSLYEGRLMHRVAGIVSRRPLTHDDTRELIRPLLGISRLALRSYVESSDLKWVEDPSNRDSTHLRVWFRSQVIPRIRRCCPKFDQVVIESAQRLQRVTRLRDKLVQRQLMQVMDKGARRIFDCCPPLSIHHLNQLASVDQEAVLREWIHAGAQNLPGAQALSLLLEELDEMSLTEHAPKRYRTCRLDWNRVSIREYRGRLYLLGTLPDPASDIVWNGDSGELRPGLSVEWQGQSEQRMGGTWQEGLVWRWRAGSERIRLPGRAHRTSIKKACQAFGIPYWERNRLPFLTKYGEVVWLHGIGWCGQMAGEAASASFRRVQPEIRLIWNPTG